jgi:hypothetical protein
MVGDLGMAEILVAPVGDHPAVVSATVEKLKYDNLAVERVHILCPNEPMIKQGVEWLELELDDKFQLAIDRHMPTRSKQQKSIFKRWPRCFRLAKQ